jgi:hypothetical protein
MVLQAFDHAFLYMYDTDGMYSRGKIAGEPVEMSINWSGNIFTLMTPRSRTLGARNDNFDYLQALEEALQHRPHYIHVYVKVPSTATMTEHDKPVTWNPYLNYENADQDFEERCAYVRRVLQRNKIACDNITFDVGYSLPNSWA